MSSLSKRFEALRARNEKALVLFVTAGDQPLDELPRIVEALTEGGADVLEVGIPFSDPFGEGPTIQASSQRSLENGTTPRLILSALSKIHANIPIVTMGYYNPVLRHGLGEFARQSAAAGVAGTIISDLVPEEADEWVEVSAANSLDTIFLAAPTSTEARIREVAEKSSGFIYLVSRTGVTGAESQVPPDVAGLVSKVRALTEKPICVGFGVSTPEHVQMVCQVADGAVVGSALVKLLHEKWQNGKGYDEVVGFVRSLKAAARES